MPVSTPPGPSSTIVVAPLPLRVSRDWRHRTGLHNWAESRPGHSPGSVWTRASTLATTGASGEWNATVSSVWRRRVRAESINWVWNAPDTGRGRTFRAPSSFALSAALATASTVPAMTTWPGAL
jgi:hypothetical protein